MIKASLLTFGAISSKRKQWELIFTVVKHFIPHLALQWVIQEWTVEYEKQDEKYLVSDIVMLDILSQKALCL